jgi:hypothetical protein
MKGPPGPELSLFIKKQVDFLKTFAVSLLSGPILRKAVNTFTKRFAMADYKDPISPIRDLGFYFVWNSRECRLSSRSHPAICLMDITGF